jgi:hypothetical protein
MARLAPRRRWLRPYAGRAAGRGRGTPVVSATPSRITVQPPAIARVTRSPRNSAPHSTAKAGIRYSTTIVRAAPVRAISWKNST